MSADPPAPQRLESLDALRGFDMLWIVGGAEVLRAWAEASNWGPLQWAAGQTEHVAWNGFAFWDLIFPLFLFLAGVSLPFSIAARRARGESERALHLHALRRAALLVLLGLVYNGLLLFDFAHLRCASVLGRIGLAWLGAALIALHAGPRGRALWAAGLLLGYWAALVWFPVPGFGAGDLEPGATVTDWFDRRFLPGVLYRGDRDPEGLLGTVPAIATALLGVLAGDWLRRGDRSGERKALGLFGAGAAGLAFGWLWSRALPLNKNLWTSSFALWCAGWSALLLAAFYFAIDVRGWRRWAFPLQVIGVNSITIYMLARFVDFDALAGLALGQEPARLHPVLLAGGGLALEWLLLWWLWRRRIFLRV